MISTNSFSSFRRCSIAGLLALGLAAFSTSNLDAQVVYNTIPSPLPGSVESQAPQGGTSLLNPNFFRELGDGFTVTKTGNLGVVTVIMVSFACQSGFYFSNDCVSAPGATFNQPLTFNVYSVKGGPGTWAPNTLLATLTKTLPMPYRPSYDPVNCAGTGEWYDIIGGICLNGLAFPVSMDFTSMHVTIPQNIIVTVTFNTTLSGYAPIGPAPCDAGPGGCPYDFLNISSDTTDGVFNFVGAPLDPNGIFVNWVSPTSSCSGTESGTLQLDTPCWTGEHPEIRVSLAGTSFPLSLDQQPFLVRYAADITAGDSDVDIINTGFNGSPLSGPGFGANTGNICVNVYAIDPSEELVSCCSCLITPNQTVNLGVKSVLLATTLTGQPPPSVTIKLLASAGAPVDPVTLATPGAPSCMGTAASAGTPANSVLPGGFLAFGTSLHATTLTGPPVLTESPFLPVTFGITGTNQELASLTGRCASIMGNSSTHGVCAGCSPGALGGTKQ